MGIVSMEEDFGGDLCKSLETSRAVTVLNSCSNLGGSFGLVQEFYQVSPLLVSF